MRLTNWPLVAYVSAPLLCAATRPSYGGTIRVQMRASPESIPDSEQLSNLVFEPLVAADERGQPVSVLAVAWKQVPGGNRWEFQLRRGVKFHDGSVLTPSAA